MRHNNCFPFIERTLKLKYLHVQGRRLSPTWWMSMSKMHKTCPPQSIHFHINLVRVQYYEAPQYDILHTLQFHIYLTSKSDSQPKMSSYVLTSVQVSNPLKMTRLIYARLQEFKADNIMITTFWFLMPCSLVRCTDEWKNPTVTIMRKWKKLLKVSTKRRPILNIPHGISIQRAQIFMWNCTFLYFRTCDFI